jgi:hypothetical protein
MDTTAITGWRIRNRLRNTGLRETGFIVSYPQHHRCSKLDHTFLTFLLVLATESSVIIRAVRSIAIIN